MQPTTKSTLTALGAAPVFFLATLLLSTVELQRGMDLLIYLLATVTWPLFLGAASKVWKRPVRFILSAAMLCMGTTVGLLIDRWDAQLGWLENTVGLLVVGLFTYGFVAAFTALGFTVGAILCVLFFGNTALPEG